MVNKDMIFQLEIVKHQQDPLSTFVLKIMRKLLGLYWEVMQISPFIYQKQIKWAYNNYNGSTELKIINNLKKN